MCSCDCCKLIGPGPDNYGRNKPGEITKRVIARLAAALESKKDALRNEKGNNESGHEAEAHGKDEG